MNLKPIEKVLIGLFLLTFAIIGYDFYTSTNYQFSNSSDISYSRLLEYIKMGWVNQLDLYMNNRMAIIEASSPDLGDRPQLLKADLPIAASQLIEKLKESDISFDSHPIPKKNLYIKIAYNLLIPSIFITTLIYFFQSSNNIPGLPNFPNFPGGPGSFLMNLGKSPAKLTESTSDISFNDVKGIEEVKEEVEEIVSFLTEQDKYTLVGAKIPKGVLLVGPPGTGKTLLAKAIANEANVPFYNAGGGEFIELFVGVGASRMRDLFVEANKNAPCIVFIDEIDAIARQRGGGYGSASDEREQTLNQLLSELDGFKENSGVILVGATNRVDILDAALLRPGRFDRIIDVPLPSRLGRSQILDLYAMKLPLDENVSLLDIADKTPGFSGAELANLLNEAAILTARYKNEKITKNEINEAFERVIGGIAGMAMEIGKIKTLIAYHEIGHAIVGSLLKNHDNVEKITLIPRGGAKGLTWFKSRGDARLFTRAQLTSRIITLYGGRAAETIIFGKSEITTGASNDIQRVTEIAYKMVTVYGMSSLGPRAFIKLNKTRQFPYPPRPMMSVKTRIKVGREVHKILKGYEQVANRIIFENRVIMDLLVERLLDTETFEGEEFYKLLNQYSNLPKKNSNYQKI
uniref:ATP-dependent zinc metalloprotease FtsH n=1 Tax=Climaconeis cf. scalaris TaxID=2846828 RepID=A0A8F8SRZ1_9STRA|nr:cell division protein [Climaconeis cf. scalaris]QYB19317.1 cell division protein [Climaconeis cf. scalaris]